MCGSYLKPPASEEMLAAHSAESWARRNEPSRGLQLPLPTNEARFTSGKQPTQAADMMVMMMMMVRARFVFLFSTFGSESDLLRQQTLVLRLKRRQVASPNTKL